MVGEMILLRVVDGVREGWNCMPLEEFLERVNLNSWRDGQELVGVVLPPARTPAYAPDPRDQAS